MFLLGRGWWCLMGGRRAGWRFVLSFSFLLFFCVLSFSMDGLGLGMGWGWGWGWDGGYLWVGGVMSPILRLLLCIDCVSSDAF